MNSTLQFAAAVALALTCSPGVAVSQPGTPVTRSAQQSAVLSYFHDVLDGRQVSTDGGSSPHWSAQGNELFYLDAANDMQAAHVTTKPTFAIQSKERLFSASGYFVSPWSQAYDVTPDGQRFLMLRVGSATGAESASLVLVENFVTDVQQRMATR